jgi:hypothetical protein
MQATADAVDQAAKEVNSNVHAIPGQGELLGTKLETGSDREQRDDARRVYEETIREIAGTGALGDLPRAWDDVRHYRDAGSAEKALNSLEIFTRPRTLTRDHFGGAFLCFSGRRPIARRFRLLTRAHRVGMITIDAARSHT